MPDQNGALAGFLDLLNRDIARKPNRIVRHESIFRIPGESDGRYTGQLRFSD
jgi:hypothetical protein